MVIFFNGGSFIAFRKFSTFSSFACICACSSFMACRLSANFSALTLMSSMNCLNSKLDISRMSFLDIFLKSLSDKRKKSLIALIFSRRLPMISLAVLIFSTRISNFSLAFPRRSLYFTSTFLSALILLISALVRHLSNEPSFLYVPNTFCFRRVMDLFQSTVVPSLLITS